jgi:hypothetical protein
MSHSLTLGDYFARWLNTFPYEATILYLCDLKKTASKYFCDAVFTTNRAFPHPSYRDGRVIRKPFWTHFIELAAIEYSRANIGYPEQFVCVGVPRNYLLPLDA